MKTAANSCLPKRPYQTKALARSALGRVRREANGSDSLRLTVYHCRFCRQWHVGKSGLLTKEK